MTNSIPLDDARKRREWQDTRVRSEPRPKGAPRAWGGFKDTGRWVGKNPPSVDWIVTGLIPARMVTLMVANGGVGKTMFAQLAMTCCAVGAPLAGRATAGGSGAGVFGEDPEGILHSRQERICRHLGCDMEDLVGRVFPISFAGLDAALWRGGKTTALFDSVEEEARRISDLRLLVIDNVALVYADNENDRVPVSGFLNALNGMAERLGCAILLLTHTSKSSEAGTFKAASGSTAWINGARSVLQLKVDDEDPGRVELKLVKSNHARPGDQIDLRWSDGGVLDIDPDVGTDGTVGRLDRRARVTRAKDSFLACLAALEGQGRIVTDARNSPRYAPKVMVAMPEANHARIPDLAEAMETLFADMEIHVGTVSGPDRKPMKAIVRGAKGAP
ncbi:AAA family ATPase [Pararhodospirillum oryzae]|uniref:AAA+ ATPase domain-containing protein n=1 Tax=Pararhodospirillum oryzae TaxID=478448 RepID=A0A512HC69_9PROT|nr:AAA family ATPase [Pararhodospirillum oryzae]GEO83038.1 hypothetical protein ROR02_31690 [Pararhodospirillum oryzae]